MEFVFFALIAAYFFIPLCRDITRRAFFQALVGIRLEEATQTDVDAVFEKLMGDVRWFRECARQRFIKLHHGYGDHECMQICKHQLERYEELQNQSKEIFIRFAATARRYRFKVPSLQTERRVEDAAF